MESSSSWKLKPIPARDSVLLTEWTCGRCGMTHVDPGKLEGGEQVCKSCGQINTIFPVTK